MSPQKSRIPGWKEMDDIQDEYLKLAKAHEREIKALKLQYLKDCEVLYKKRSTFVKEINCFWIIQLLADDMLEEEITSDDVEALNYLYDIVCLWKDDGFKLSFFFKTNPYFSNNELTIDFGFKGNKIIKIKGSIIDWCEGRNLTKKQLPSTEIPDCAKYMGKKYNIIDQESMTLKRVSGARNHDETEENKYDDSFFNLFDNLVFPGEDGFKGTLVEGSIVHDEERVEQSRSRVSWKHRIGKTICDTIIPQSWTIKDNDDVSVGHLLEELKVLQSNHIRLAKDFFEAEERVVNEYNKKCQKLQDMRLEVLVRSAGDSSLSKFWLRAMLGHALIALEITVRDHDALEYLRDIRSSTTKEPRSFKLDFYFDKNCYFKNSVLSKTYYMTEDIEPTLKKVVGTKIDWYSGKELTLQLLKKRKKKGGISQDPKSVECRSFFSLFGPVELLVDQSQVDHEVSSYMRDHDLIVMQQEYDIASAFRDQVIPMALASIALFNAKFSMW